MKYDTSSRTSVPSQTELPPTQYETSLSNLTQRLTWSVVVTEESGTSSVTSGRSSVSLYWPYRSPWPSLWKSCTLFATQSSLLLRGSYCRFRHYWRPFAFGANLAQTMPKRGSDWILGDCSRSSKQNGYDCDRCTEFKGKRRGRMVMQVKHIIFSRVLSYC